MKRRRPLREDKGFVLVTVLMALSVLAGIAVALTISSRTNMLFASSHAEIARAEAAADAGVAIATILILKNPKPPLNFVCQFEGSRLAISIEDEGGKIDLNAASPKLIAELLAGILSDERRALEIADLIADFVDPDDEDRLTQRSELERYAAINGPSPKNSWFATVDELEQVAGLMHPLANERTLFEHLRPLVTVWSRRSGFDRNVASRELLQLLERVEGTLSLDASLGTEARFYTVTSRAMTKSGGRYSREVTIERDAGVRDGYRIRSFLSRPFDDEQNGQGASNPTGDIDCSLLLAG